MKRWFVPALTAALVTAGVVAAVAVAGGGAAPGALVDRGVHALTGGGADSTSSGPGEAWRYCGEDAFRAGPAFDAVDDPEARAGAEALRERHRAEMREWWEQYGDEPRSQEAQGSLERLRERQRNEFRELCEEYGIEAPNGARRGDGGRDRGMFGDGGGEACGRGHGVDGAPGAASNR